MIREGFKNQIIGANREFRHRGIEPGRLENFSDACFALAITLLLISTSPPTSFEQVRRFVWELIPFTMCIALIILIWNEHFIFFYRYGLRHGGIIVLNSIFLVLALFYVYPLKFLTRMALLPLAKLFNEEKMFTELSGMIGWRDWGDLMAIYGIGAAAVFSVLALMYRYAYKKSEELELTEIEKFDTRVKIKGNLLMAAVPLASAIAAMILNGTVWAGVIPGPMYFLYTPIMLAHGKRVEKNRIKLLAKLNAEPAPLLETAPG